MRSFESRIESRRVRIVSNSGADSSSLVLTAFCSRTQVNAFDPVTSSSQRYGSAVDSVAIDSAEIDGAVRQSISRQMQETSACKTISKWPKGGRMDGSIQIPS